MTSGKAMSPLLRSNAGRSQEVRVVLRSKEKLLTRRHAMRERPRLSESRDARQTALTRNCSLSSLSVPKARGELVLLPDYPVREIRLYYEVRFDALAL